VVHNLEVILLWRPSINSSLHFHQQLHGSIYILYFSIFRVSLFSLRCTHNVLLLLIITAATTWICFIIFIDISTTYFHSFEGKRSINLNSFLVVSLLIIISNSLNVSSLHVLLYQSQVNFVFALS